MERLQGRAMNWDKKPFKIFFEYIRRSPNLYINKNTRVYSIPFSHYTVNYVVC